MTPAEIRAIDAQARAGFTYVPDGPRDTWRSHADDVAAGRPWAGDCDDLASTVLDLLGRAGLPLDRRYRLAVSSAGGEAIDHLIAAAVDDAGGIWVVGDTFGPAYWAANCWHQPIQYQRLDEVRAGVTAWRLGAPWVRK